MRIHLENYRIVFIAVGLIGVLLFASPTINVLIKPPVGEQFSGLYILGPNHMMQDIPFNIRIGTTYSVYLGVQNEMGSASYYRCIVKIRNGTDPLPNATLGTSSNLPILYEYNSIFKNGKNWEAPLAFQVNKLTITDRSSHLNSITINGLTFSVNKDSEWNSDKNGYYYSLLVELWIFNSTLGTLQYHNRFVSLGLNVVQ